jgi:hypothetical protein
LRLSDFDVCRRRRRETSEMLMNFLLLLMLQSEVQTPRFLSHLQQQQRRDISQHLTDSIFSASRVIIAKFFFNNILISIALHSYFIVRRRCRYWIKSINKKNAFPFSPMFFLRMEPESTIIVVANLLDVNTRASNLKRIIINLHFAIIK